MKTLAISAVTVFGLLATTQVADAAALPRAAKQTVKFSVTGDCKDEEEMIEDESKDNCKIVVKISPTTPTRSAILEQLNDDDEWDEVASAKSKSGKITFSIEATDEDDLWLDGDFTFQVRVKKSGTNKAVVSDEYTFTFTPAESEDEDSGSGEASSKQKGKSTGNTKLDSVLDKMDDKNNTYDDNCEKSFGADCKLMFTPTGPNWAKLTTAKWQAMCEKLLKQTAANCKSMYGASAPPPGSSNNNQGGSTNNNQGGSTNNNTGGSTNNNQGGSTNNNQGGSTNNPGGSAPVKVTEADVKKACTAAGITDCDPVVRAILGSTPPSQSLMSSLLGNKMDAFFKAMPAQPNSGSSNNQPK